MYRVTLVLQHSMAVGSQLINFIPRPEFRAIIRKIGNGITNVRSGLTRYIVTLVRSFFGLERRIESFESTTNAHHQSDLEELESQLREATAERDDLRESNVSLEAGLRNLTSEIFHFKSRLAEKEKIADRKSYVEQEACHKDNPNGTLLWKIERYQRKREDAINGVATALYSPPFYSAQYGYKMCAKLYMNGDGFGKGTHLSLFFVVMKGELPFEMWALIDKMG